MLRKMRDMSASVKLDIGDSTFGRLGKGYCDARERSRESIAKRRIWVHYTFFFYNSYYLYRRSIAARYPYSTDCTMHKDTRDGFVVHHIIISWLFSRVYCSVLRCPQSSALRSVNLQSQSFLNIHPISSTCSCVSSASALSLFMKS
jgi:hypothetical protein